MMDTNDFDQSTFKERFRRYMTIGVAFLAGSILLTFGVFEGCKKKEETPVKVEEQKKEEPKETPKKVRNKTPMGRVLDMKPVEDGCLISTENTVNPTMIRGGCPAFFKDETAEHDITIENGDSVSEWICFEKADMCSRVN
jgi:hypothetical protein